MKHAHWLLPLAVLLCCFHESSAQVPFSPFVPGYAVGPGIGFNYRNRHLAVSGYLGPSVYGHGFRGWPPYYPYYASPISTVTYIYSPPPPIVMMPPIVINNNQTVVVGNGMQVDREDDGQFLKIIPRQRRQAADAAADRNERPMRPAEPKERPARKEPAAEARPKKPEAKPEPARPARNPKDENARLNALGKQAFNAQQHGLAERRFQKAVESAPAEPMAYFLLAQAQFALGKYREAVDSIHAGMRRQPDWPGAAFDPRDLYGDNPEDFQDHLKRLDEVLAANPNDPVLLFLAGHQLWFTGKVAEARVLFERAARVAADRSFCDRFLKARPAAPVARLGITD